MKKLINRPEEVVDDALHGLQRAHPQLLKVNFDPVFVVRSDAPVASKVGIVSGGGSGHEPLHSGFVGRGMLDAACPGAVFTSPTPDQILAATRAVDGGAGVLHIVKNYSGDVMNFDIAAELVADEGIEVASVVIDDDVGVENSIYTAGRRGVGATVLAEKICGAAAEEGQPLARVANVCRQVNECARSMGIALTSCIVPAAGRPTFAIGERDMEVGIGIHGEPGRQRLPVQSADAITDLLSTVILKDLPFVPGDRVIVMVNGMGGTPLIELYIVFRHLATVCDQHQVTIERNLIGNYITSLEMAGCSITLLKVDDELLRLWDAPVLTPALSW
jgi:dihydroxyacetone kinase-like protein